MGADEAHAITDAIRNCLIDLHDLLERAYTGRVWVALGYRDWDAYCATEFLGQRKLKLERQERRSCVAFLRKTGLSIRRISSVVGADKNTVQTDLDHVSEIHTRGGEAITDSGRDELTITGRDGKTYSYPRRKPREIDKRQLQLDEIASRVINNARRDASTLEAMQQWHRKWGCNDLAQLTCISENLAQHQQTLKEMQHLLDEISSEGGA